jgi:hypothetical protein
MFFCIAGRYYTYILLNNRIKDAGENIKPNMLDIKLYKNIRCPKW